MDPRFLLTIPQLEQLAEAIGDRYRALVVLAERTGLRFGECAALRWSDLDLATATDDGAVAVTVAPAPKTRTGGRTIALDRETMKALKAHRGRYGDDPPGRVFTFPGGGHGPGGMRGAPDTSRVAQDFRRVWSQAVQAAGLAGGSGAKTATRPARRGRERTGRQDQQPHLGFHWLRTSHVTHLLVLGVPLRAVAARLGYASITIISWRHAPVLSMVGAGRLKPADLGLPADHDGQRHGRGDRHESSGGGRRHPLS